MIKPAKSLMRTDNYDKTHVSCIASIESALPKNAGAELKRFVRQFYNKVPVLDLVQYDPSDAASLAKTAFGFLSKRTLGKPKIAIYMPTKAKHGYGGQRMVIEILNDDRPFLVDSLSAELGRQGFTIRETLHPIFWVKRNKKGVMQSLANHGKKKEEGVYQESLIHFEITGLSDDKQSIEQLKKDLLLVLKYVHAAVDDWPLVLQKADDMIEGLTHFRSYKDDANAEEARDFICWLKDKNFVFLGYAEYSFFDANGQEKFSAIPGSSLGVARVSNDIILRGLRALPQEIRHSLLEPQILEITKSTRRSYVHRSVPMDYIAIKRFDKKGKVVGEARFLGLFTSSVYYQSADEIPLMRQKIDRVMTRANFASKSHSGKALKAILEFMPRDEVFQMSDDELFDSGMGILSLEAKPGVRVFARRDSLERFVSLMVFVPRERFSTEIRRQIQSLVEAAYDGVTSSFTTQIAEAPLARLHVIVRTTPGKIPAVDIAKIEAEISRRVYLWSDLLYNALIEECGEANAEALHRMYATAFSEAYIYRYDASAAVYDIGKIEEALASDELSLELYEGKKAEGRYVHLKLYNPKHQIALSDFLPILETAGFFAVEEHPFQITTASGTVWLHDFKLELKEDVEINFNRVKPLIEEALFKAWTHEVERDRFNSLVLLAALDWRQVSCIRAYAKYLKQIGFSYSQGAIEQAMLQQPEIACSLVELFEARFDPSVKDTGATQKKVLAVIEKQLGEVKDAVTDRILQSYANVITATLRTNYFQRDAAGHYKPVLSFKLNSKKVPQLPLPHPYAEIYVYSVQVEGIHLRGGKVARGGLRWSDRHEDFRTEILGLVKAQMVKNTVIVPLGSKGGFVVKNPPTVGGREAFMKEGISCYKKYLSGLLDLTDNIVKGKVVPPKKLVRHDGDDPYLVVAADKGTATFSDIANSISADYGFWLGDAFASGGSVGYDHKKMGITARGAWVSVERHFREMGHEVSKQDFTVVGIGDMAGDVFGNGMLLSEHICLVAAFNHMHIFIDPTPNAKRSFAERKRLFERPRSSWKDYNAKLISKGGAIFDRSSKTISLSKEARNALGIDKTTMTPDELIRCVLKAPVDLLWNGGIGTYVKAEEETHEQVGDRGNNAVRVNGIDLRCKVVGEGGNLGLTQRGRIEYARNGGRLNTDAIDNSAGVDCSDHEVNIKIAFSGEVARGALSMPQRDKLLESMTDEVAFLCLKDNILQTQALTVAEQQGAQQLESQARLMHLLEQEGLLDRKLEDLPTDKQITELKAAHKGLTRPELSVLLSYSKMIIYNELLDSSLPDEQYFEADLRRYFPAKMRKDFEEAIANHQLRREIIATMATNSIVNRAGITFFSDISEDLGVSARDIVAAYTVVRDAFDLRGLWKAIENVPDVDIGARVVMYGKISMFLERLTSWLLRNLPLPLDIDVIYEEIVPGIAAIKQNKSKLSSSISRKAIERCLGELAALKVPNKLASRVAELELLSSAFDIISVGQNANMDLTDVGKLYFAVDDHLNLGWLRLCGSNIVPASHWDRLAIMSLISDLHDEQRRLTAQIIADTGKNNLAVDSAKSWFAAHGADIRRFKRFIDSIKSENTPDISRLMVALRHIRSL